MRSKRKFNSCDKKEFNQPKHSITVAELISQKLQTTNYIKPINDNQALFVKSMKENTISVAIGSAGTGKSLLALHQGIKSLNNPECPIEKLFYLRSNVPLDNEKGIGYLPGTLLEKVISLAYPVLDNLIEFMPEHQAKYLIESGRIEVLPIAMIRGRSFAKSFIIADECQNLTSPMIKTILTRISYDSKMVLIGDTEQSDLRYDLQANNGLSLIATRLLGMRDVGIVNFAKKDIVRHKIISEILERLN